MKGQATEPSRIRAIRNAQKWANADLVDIKTEIYCIEIPWKWIKDDEEEDEAVPF
jgi:hypothetical protein